MRAVDYETRDAAGAAGFEHYHAEPDWDAPSLADITDEIDDRWSPPDNPYNGTCGGCDRPVASYIHSPGGENGSCIWKGGPWHPQCRDADRNAATQAIAA